jgi:hypothetical protein
LLGFVISNGGFCALKFRVLHIRFYCECSQEIISVSCLSFSSSCFGLYNLYALVLFILFRNLHIVKFVNFCDAVNFFLCEGFLCFGIFLEDGFWMMRAFGFWNDFFNVLFLFWIFWFVLLNLGFRLIIGWVNLVNF